MGKRCCCLWMLIFGFPPLKYPMLESIRIVTDIVIVIGIVQKVRIAG
ncbi:hypothetical protein [Bacteroides sp. UBA939]|nr:hypothetical protein [Bacteroides sp. UBA939]